mgnify:CR=1 FL=1
MLGFDLDSAASLCVLFLLGSGFKTNSKTLVRLVQEASQLLTRSRIKKITKFMPSKLSKSNLANSKEK